MLNEGEHNLIGAKPIHILYSNPCQSIYNARLRLAVNFFSFVICVTYLWKQEFKYFVGYLTKVGQLKSNICCRYFELTFQECPGKVAQGWIYPVRPKQYADRPGTGGKRRVGFKHKICKFGGSKVQPIQSIDYSSRSSDRFWVRFRDFPFNISEQKKVKMLLTLYSEVGCLGNSAVIKDREVNLSKVGVSFQVKVSWEIFGSFSGLSSNYFQSAKVEGNPWILFTEERYQGFLCYLEEGR